MGYMLTGVHSPNITGDRAVRLKNMAPAYLEKEEMITEKKSQLNKKSEVISLS